jgi:hypothetical protein
MEPSLFPEHHFVLCGVEYYDKYCSSLTNPFINMFCFKTQVLHVSPTIASWIAYLPIVFPHAAVISCLYEC